jgi:hypothetical protein
MSASGPGCGPFLGFYHNSDKPSNCTDFLEEMTVPLWALLLLNCDCPWQGLGEIKRRLGCIL